MGRWLIVHRGYEAGHTASSILLKLTRQMISSVSVVHSFEDGSPFVCLDRSFIYNFTCS